MSEHRPAPSPQHDLAYVRAAVQRTPFHGTPAGISLLLAAIILVGFVLVDVVRDPEWIGRYWMVAAPLGWILSAVIGHRASRRHGQLDAGRGLRTAGHWMGMVVVMFLAALLPARGLMEWEALGHLSLLFLALCYFLAGLHVERATIWLGPWMLVGYGLALFLPAWNWSITGLTISAGLAAAPFLAQRSRVAEAA
ncbi:MAG: hypothetical protein ACYTG2_02875 [Planctomycetota bacterium]|jgi:hypothetical protein